MSKVGGRIYWKIRHRAAGKIDIENRKTVWYNVSERSPFCSDKLHGVSYENHKNKKIQPLGIGGGIAFGGGLLHTLFWLSQAEG